MTVQKDDSIFDGGFTVSERPGVVIGGPTVKSPGRGRHVDDDFLREVARVYAEARNSGEVVDVAIRNRLAGSGGSAGRWIRQAKDRGFIPE